MSVVIRPPRVSEWLACRMLLPESFQMNTPPDAFLAWDETRGTIAGLALFHRLKDETIGLRFLTVRSYRRQGIGSNLLRHVRERSRARGDERVRTMVDLLAHPEVEPFLQANGFVLESRMLRAEGVLPMAVDELRGLKDRLVASGKIPSAARAVDSWELPREDVLVAYRALIGTHLPGRPELAEYILSSPAMEEVVLLVEDRPAGMMVGVSNDGQGVASIDAMVVAPEFRSGWGWANLMLLTRGAERALAAGSSRLRFELDERNWKVLKGINRAQGKITSMPSRFVLDLVGRTRQLESV